MARRSVPVTEPAPKGIPPLDKEMYRVVVTAFADERLANQRAIIRETEDYMRKKKEAADRLEAFVKKAAVEEAIQEHALHLDNLPLVAAGKLDEADYKKTERRLKKRRHDLEAEVQNRIGQMEAELQRLAMPLRELQWKESHPVHGYAARWKLHEKRAKELGLDLSGFWVPSKPLPSEAAEGDAE